MQAAIVPVIGYATLRRRRSTQNKAFASQEECAKEYKYSGKRRMHCTIGSKAPDHIESADKDCTRLLNHVRIPRPSTSRVARGRRCAKGAKKSVFVWSSSDAPAAVRRRCDGALRPREGELMVRTRVTRVRKMTPHNEEKRGSVAVREQSKFIDAAQSRPQVAPIAICRRAR